MEVYPLGQRYCDLDLFGCYNPYLIFTSEKYGRWLDTIVWRIQGGLDAWPIRMCTLLGF